MLPALALAYAALRRGAAGARGRPPARRLRLDGAGRPAGGSRSSSCGRRRPGPTSAARRPTRLLELTLGYNGFGRLTGDETGSVGGGNGWGATGLLRLLRLRDRRPGRLAAARPRWSSASRALWFARARRHRCALGRPTAAGSAGSSSPALTFSFMAGIFHAYYTVALAPGDRRRWSGSAPGRSGSDATSLVASATLGLRRPRSPPRSRSSLLDRTADFAALAEVRRGHGRLRGAALMIVGVRHLPAPGRGRRGRGRAGRRAGRPRGVLRSPPPPPPHTGSIPSAGPGPGSVARVGRATGTPAAAGGTAAGGLLEGSDAARPALTDLLLSRRRRLHLGGGRRSAPTRPPATSWPPRAR